MSGCGLACLGMPKDAFKTLISQNLMEVKVDFVRPVSYLLKLQIAHVILDGHGQMQKCSRPIRFLNFFKELEV